ncbi:type II secretion system F family protein [Massilia rhizosphaerae]|uniref:type II secretion system F family protein n=1 Tax=Massilia rhizosphaerae TaxID=2784389 RepID=UPI0018DB7EF8
MALEWDDFELDDRPANTGAAQAALVLPPWLQWRPGTPERMLLTERLALLLDTGVSLHRALCVLRDQAERPQLRAILDELAHDIVAGQRFSEALLKHPALFPPTYTNLVGASEQGGFLSQVLQQLVEMDEQQQRLRNTMIGALAYPGFLAVFSTLVVIFILTAVFPRFSVMFKGIYDQLPLTTKILMAVSDLLIHHWALLAGGVALAAAGAAATLMRPATRHRLDRLKLRLPFVRHIFVKIYLTRLLRVMGVSLERGVTILATLGACRNVIPNAEFRQFLGEVEVGVTEGNGIAAVFRASPLIPASVKQMIDTGEETGEVGPVMRRVADFYERDLTRQLNQLAKMAEPAMLMIMGVLVGTIVTSIILPIFKMSRAVH